MVAKLVYNGLYMFIQLPEFSLRAVVYVDGMDDGHLTQLVTGRHLFGATCWLVCNPTGPFIDVFKMLLPRKS